MARTGAAAAQATLAELVEGDDGWLARRRTTHRDARNDANRWKLHLAPALGRLRPAEVDKGVLRRLIDDRLAAGLSPTTVLHAIRLLSTLFSDLVDDGVVAGNPVKNLPRRIRRLIRPAHDPRTTPFLERMEDVRRVYLELPGRIALGFAIGVMAGLRTGELLALPWEHIDIEAGRIHVRVACRDGRPTRLKDEDSRIVPIQTALVPLLKAARLASDHPLVLPPRRRDARQRFVRRSALTRALAGAMAKLKLPALTWYQATRHTFASQWVMGGGTLESLREVMGHHSVTVTERYSHLRPDDRHRDLLQVDLGRPAGTVLDLGADGTRMAPGDAARVRKSKGLRGGQAR